MLPSTWQQQHTLTSWQHMQQHLPPCPRHCSRRGLQQSPLQSSLKDAAASQQSYHAAAQRCSRQPHAHVLRAAVRTGAAGISNCATSTCRGTCCCNIQQPMLLQQQQALLQLGASRQRRQRPTHIAQAANQSAPDPWQRPPSPGGAAATTDWGGGGGGSGNGSSRRPPGGYGGPMGGNGSQSPTASYDAWDAAARPPAPGNGVPRYEQTDWGWSGAQRGAQLLLVCCPVLCTGAERLDQAHVWSCLLMDYGSCGWRCLAPISRDRWCMTTVQHNFHRDCRQPLTAPTMLLQHTGQHAGLCHCTARPQHNM